ncbi:citrate (pro-3S)-lyase subunit beta [Lactococcus lactis]|uniref:Citrate lyase subunit beta n=1 Tax=Lactococcus lactis TaxID=1358 RepID=A0AAP4DT57_9LACT|nr:citrate (pro-3S)-lyase subunit beta [Lactococcus lactis]MDG4967653.1 citrate (pro-3S)-lyase subunit beta [Lactococcus lactis]MDG4975199.1 citrate (pro-3S)-lyase subunit beta [Lactococcus lactis]MDG5101857.1 citrate (pro-3S)-lyase subunit beta [Lactococcus lactis]
MAVAERLRRTMMFVPGNNPAMIKDAGIFEADSIMFDLEDAVSLAEKDAARVLVYEAVKNIDFGGAELVVRINGLDTPFWQKDVRAMVNAGIEVIRAPKVETAAMMEELEVEIEKAEKEFGIEVGTTHVMAALESALGVMNALEIARSCPERMMGIALSGMDYRVDMKTKSYPDEGELYFARNMVLHAARAAGVAAFDTVFGNVDDEEGFVKGVELIHQLGFDGKSVINPRQIPLVNKVYAPTKKEVVHAQQVMEAIEEAKQKGSGVISLNGQMVDRPIVLQAERVLMLAKAANVLDEGGNYIEK